MITDNNSAFYRTTKQRTALLKLLESTKSHPTAAWLYERLKVDFPTMSQGTVYRNLSTLAEQGLIQILDTGSAFERFDADTSEHYHLICECCGKIDDLNIEPDTTLSQKAEEASGYSLSYHRLYFYGICPECQKLKRGEESGIKTTLEGR